MADNATPSVLRLQFPKMRSPEPMVQVDS